MHFQQLFWIYCIHKHGGMRSKSAHTKSVFLKSELTQDLTKCTHCITMNFFSRERYLNQKVKFSGPLFRISGLFQGFPGPMPFSRTFQAWKYQHFNFRTFQGLYEPCLTLMAGQQKGHPTCKTTCCGNLQRTLTGVTPDT